MRGDDIIGFAVEATQSPWLAALVLLCLVLSAVLPPVPSTSLVVAVAAVPDHVSPLQVLILAASMMIGSILGDLLVYAIGGRVDVASWRLSRGPRRQRALAEADRRLSANPDLALVISRFVPLARLACGLMAGTGSLTLRRYLRSAVLAAAVWAAYSIAVGRASAAWIELPVPVTVGLAIVISLVIGRLVSWVDERGFLHRSRD